MAAKICVLGLILSSSPYLRCALGGLPLYNETGKQHIAFQYFHKNVGTSNAQHPALPKLPPREAIGDIDNIEKDDTAKENINIEERGAYIILVEVTQSKETVSN